MKSAAIPRAQESLRIVTKRLGLFILCFAVASCSTAPIKSDEITGTFESNLKNLDLTKSFSFTQGVDDFYFSEVLLKEGDSKCRFIIGFKNNQFKYSFPAFRMEELSKIYYEKYPLQKKKELALRKIEAFEVEKQKCTKEIAERETTTSEYVEGALYLIIFAPIMPLGLVFGADVWVDGIEDSILERKMNRLRLGMTTAEVKSLLDRELTKNRIAHYEYYSLDFGSYQRFVAVFEKDRLTGFIRGFRDASVHKE